MVADQIISKGVYMVICLKMQNTCAMY